MRLGDILESESGESWHGEGESFICVRGRRDIWMRSSKEGGCLRGRQSTQPHLDTPLEAVSHLLFWVHATLIATVALSPQPGDSWMRAPARPTTTPGCLPLRK
ncbi:unnamed protein product [Rangifer tarandus platyrhynchus]|uniref:Uncharacterized protein n=1 Tax=Rangifer tarandus platyrhynchus TaxID=3082113 RepID=A0AC59YSD2_RANTA